MKQVAEAPPARRQTYFTAVRSGLALWCGGPGEVQSQNQRNAANAGFCGQINGHFERLSYHSMLSKEWLKEFLLLKAAFEGETLHRL